MVGEQFLIYARFVQGVTVHGVTLFYIIPWTFDNTKNPDEPKNNNDNNVSIGMLMLFPYKFLNSLKEFKCSV